MDVVQDELADDKSNTVACRGQGCSTALIPKYRERLAAGNWHSGYETALVLLLFTVIPRWTGCSLDWVPIGTLPYFGEHNHACKSLA